ncbi:MAG: hypothetical protein R6U56_05695 [Opitutales bacterium]
MLQKVIPVLLLAALVALSGCVHYIDNPPEYTFSGIAIESESGEPVIDATVWIQSKRKYITLFPVDTFGVVETARTDEKGKFSITTKVNWPTSIIIQNAELFGAKEIKDNSEKRKSIEVKLSDKPEAWKTN